MDIITVLTSLNKIGLVAFIITLGFLVYEIYLLSKTRNTEEKPEVPQFKEDGQPVSPAQTIIREEKKRWNELLTSKNKTILVVLSILLIVFGILTAMEYFANNLTTSRVDSLSPSLIPTRPATKTIDTPTPILLPTEVLQVEQLEEPTPEVTEETPASKGTGEGFSEESTSVQATSTPAPTAIEKLPVTSNIINSLVLLGLAGILVLASLLL
ncbi:hypothetical protein A2774_01735 [Candidatus Roizmanbacteria bacterium RIFCSPHIGHO2_01_FULL_39_12c]|uniref:Uncharacterized protein n=1 Tax=Candidatus Roizmanbacteria bacterium RIFCSPHIGHO2_01_FULL_39_12c TaxID=1802031 RepID=A0A1F7GBW1_9BACT|nr:MAG: hypothetical protein A2774_01735 [Candidatus Roizmanbacteria bacterium RIFCSPHIGHO2_01_FULL_39_12c]OGK46913.1 MAG: hypothetical protein A2963_05145 [Candidatus Roizmanbacteria bacterium RIFCSPLOWO2_01_FULL_40_13]